MRVKYITFAEKKRELQQEIKEVESNLELAIKRGDDFNIKLNQSILNEVREEYLKYA